MQGKTDSDSLGGVVKSSRKTMRITQSELANRLGITARHIKAIENNRQKPSYDLLFRIIRELSIPADRIFHPEFSQNEHELAELRLLLGQCDEKEVNFFKTALRSILENK